MDNNLGIQELFYNHYSPLDEEVILRMNENYNSGELSNVVLGLERHCYGLILQSDEKEIKYQLFYVNGDKMLEGDILDLTVDLKFRDELVMYFANYLSHKYKNLNLLDIFNTYQRHTRGMLEKIGFLTISSTEIEKYVDYNPSIIAKGVRGIIPLRILRKGDFYKQFFGVKRPGQETPNNEYVYLMLNKRNELIKIGKSKNPTFREKTLQSDEPDIELISFWEVPSRLEKELHREFSQKRKRGEWFDLDFNDLKRIKEILNDYENKGN